MNKICTSLEQSKKLIELGIDVNTADMFYRDNGVDVKLMWEHLPDVQVTNPAWSLSALLGLMPFHIIENNVRYGFKQWKGCNLQGENYCFGYKSNYYSFLFETSLYKDVVDAAFEMICWLKENKKI